MRTIEVVASVDGRANEWRPIFIVAADGSI
jgi:hypothetical protein